MAAITRVADGLFRPDLTHQATVYGTDAAGRYLTVLQTAVPCTLVRVGQANGSGDAGASRAELANQRELHWDPSYVLPEQDAAEVEIDGVRWHPLTGSFDAMEGPTGEIFYRLATVRRVGA